MTYLGIRPPPFWVSISLVAELGGGLALIAGLLVPLAAAGLVAQTIVLSKKVHWPNGFWTTKGGIEFPIAFGVGAFAVQVLGPGARSLDALLPVGRFLRACRALDGARPGGSRGADRCVHAGAGGSGAIGPGGIAGPDSGRRVAIGQARLAA